MKILLAVLTLALFGSLSAVAQENSCPIGSEKLIKTLEISSDQCGRMSIAFDEAEKEIQPAIQQVMFVDQQIQSLTYESDMNVEDQVRKMADLIRERRQLVVVARNGQEKRSRQLLNILNVKQRAIVAQLAALAPTVGLFNDATGLGLIPWSVAYPVSSPALGFTSRSRQ
jgi:hypothetical protein